MTQKEFKDISIRGRVAYCINCLNNYLKAIYPDSDYSSVIDLACKITENSNYIDESTMAFTEIIPEYLYEFDNYEDAEFEYISKEQYDSFIRIIPKDDDDLNTIMHSIRDIAWEYCYTSIDEGAKKNLIFIINTVDVLKSKKISIPDIDEYKKFIFSKNDGWGDYISRDEYLNK